MRLTDALRIRPGLTALIGGGGKTTLMYTLAGELRAEGRVLVCTSTKIMRPEGLPVLNDPSPAELTEALTACRLVCVGTPWEGGKLAAPALPFETLTALADWVLVEADGAKGLPVKAHATWEPVIPANAGRTILVIGADCFGRPIGESCHRPQRFAELTAAALTDPVTPENVDQLIHAEGYGNIIYVNKCETDQDRENARALAALRALPVVAGSLWRGEWTCLY